MIRNQGYKPGTIFVYFDLCVAQIHKNLKKPEYLPDFLKT